LARWCRMRSNEASPSPHKRSPRRRSGMSAPKRPLQPTPLRVNSRQAMPCRPSQPPGRRHVESPWRGCGALRCRVYSWRRIVPESAGASSAVLSALRDLSARIIPRWMRPFIFRVNKLPMSVVLEGRVAPDMVALVRCPMAHRTLMSAKRGGGHVEYLEEQRTRER
jgi:hypothetical protein